HDHRISALCAASKNHADLPNLADAVVEGRKIREHATNAPDAQITSGGVVNGCRYIGHTSEQKRVAHCPADVTGGQEMFWRNRRSQEAAPLPLELPTALGESPGWGRGVVRGITGANENDSPERQL